MKKDTLQISATLSLPLEAVTQTFGILGKRGAGKTNTAVVVAEEMIRAGLPNVIVDPVGVWWGLRSSKDGQRKGLPVYIFGGEQGDIPLEETAGQLVADFIVETRQPVVLDVSTFSKSAARRFMTDYQRHRAEGARAGPGRHAHQPTPRPHPQGRPHPDRGPRRPPIDRPA